MKNNIVKEAKKAGKLTCVVALHVWLRVSKRKLLNGVRFNCIIIQFPELQ